MLGDGRIRKERARALLDPCSESTLVNANLARRLGSGLEKVEIGIAGVGGQPSNFARVRTQLYLYSEDSNTPLLIEVYGLRNIGIITPSVQHDSNLIHIWKDLKLADPNFVFPQEVDVILGANVYGMIVQPGLLRKGELLAQQTIFGWVISGACRTQLSSQITSASTFMRIEEPWCEQLIGQLKRFWSFEEIPSIKRTSPEDCECENQYKNQHTRDSSGRYIVPLPKRTDPPEVLGDSLPNARLALASIHRRMRRDLRLKEEYTRFMENYLHLRHMRLE